MGPMNELSHELRLSGTEPQTAAHGVKGEPAKEARCQTVEVRNSCSLAPELRALLKAPGSGSDLLCL